MPILGGRQTQPQPTAADDGGPVYDAEVNKNDVSVKWLPHHLNKRARDGWRLHSTAVQNGNLILIWERWR